MEPSEERTGTPPGQARWFATTHWSVVLAAGGTTSPGSAAALEQLCRTYWYPIYAFVRREGHDEESAKDLAQGFFAKFLEKQIAAQARRERGKFRSFLLTSLKHFLSDERDKAQAQKRGGKLTFVSLDDATVENRYRLEPVDAMDAEKLYERSWALALLDRARERLREAYVQTGNAELFERMKVFESGKRNAPTYAELAAQWEMTESAVNSAAARWRQRFREMVLGEVANTVSSPEEIPEEINYLMRVIGR